MSTYYSTHYQESDRSNAEKHVEVVSTQTQTKMWLTVVIDRTGEEVCRVSNEISNVRLDVARVWIHFQNTIGPARGSCQDTNAPFSSNRTHVSRFLRTRFTLSLVNLCGYVGRWRQYFAGAAEQSSCSHEAQSHSKMWILWCKPTDS